MMRPGAAAVVYLCVAATDLRKQAASLALLVEQSLKRDVFARVAGGLLVRAARSSAASARALGPVNSSTTA